MRSEFFPIRATRSRILLLGALTLSTLASGAGNSHYQAGRQALEDGRWQSAIEAFEASRRSHEDVPDAALYWQSYALYRSGNSRAARTLIERLRSRYPDSNWLDDAEALMLEHDSAARDSALSSTTLDDSLRLYALQQMMHSRPERALPLLRELLDRSDDPQIKQQAMMVLATSGTPETETLLIDLAMRSDDAATQKAAVHGLGIASSPSAVEALTRLYTRTSFQEVKRQVIHAYIIADAEQALLDIVREESDDDLWRAAVQALGAIGQSEQLDALYQSGQAASRKQALLQAIAIAGNLDALVRIFDQETDPDIQREVLRSMAIVDQDLPTRFWRDRYEQATDRTIRDGIIEALIIRSDDADLLREIALTDSDRQLRERAVHALAIGGNTAILSALYAEAADAETRASIVSALGMLDSTELIEDILDRETDPELRAQAYRALGIQGSSRAGALLISQYSAATPVEKRSIIEALMISQSGEALFELFAQEDDPQLRRDILRTLTLIDDPETTERMLELLETSQ